MTLVVEDGTNVPNANSYVTDEEYTDYAAARGIPVGIDATVREIELAKGMDYVEFFDSRFKGHQTWDDQWVAWPRSQGLYDYPFPTKVLKEAQILAAIASRSMALFPTTVTSSKFVTRKTVGPLTIEQEQSASNNSRQRVPQADILLRSIFSGGAGQVPVVRA